FSRDWSSYMCSSDLKASMQGFEMLLYGTVSTLYDEEARRWVLGAQGFRDALGFLRTMFAEELTLPLAQHLDPNISESIYSTLLRSEERRVGKEWTSQ